MLGEPIPQGYRRMQDAQVKPAWQRWAKQINDQTYPGHYGEIFHNTIDGVPIAAVIEHHTYTIRDGQRIPGAYHGTSLLWPPEETPAPQPVSLQQKDSTGRTVELLILGSALFGTALSAALAYFRSKKPKSQVT